MTNALCKTTLVNLRLGHDCDVYIGRSRDHFHFGNPFGRTGIATVIVPSKTIAIRNFRRWLDGVEFQEVEPQRRDWILQNLGSLKGRRIGCFCAPHPCHGDVYIEKLHEGELFEF